MKKLIWLLAITLLTPLTLAATLKGSVYDFSLTQTRAVVEINTTPKQTMISDNYIFQVKPGTYLVTARKLEGDTITAYTNETVTITENGTFVKDLILFPQVEVNESVDVEQPEVSPEEFDWDTVDQILPFAALACILLILFAFRYSYQQRMKEKEWEEDLGLDDDAAKVLEFVDKEKREKFPYSQSKISLILTDLEDQGLIRKIKQGRGNVVIRN